MPPSRPVYAKEANHGLRYRLERLWRFWLPKGWYFGEVRQELDSGRVGHGDRRLVDLEGGKRRSGQVDANVERQAHC